MTIGLYRQRRGDKKRGPLDPSLDAIAAVTKRGRPVSLVGKELADRIRGRGVSVIFFPTGGDGATPVTDLVILDVSYKDAGQAETPTSIGLVAHELTHVLQRSLPNSNYWPSGWPRPSQYTRWFADSTNYMEVLAYIVGWTVEYDLLNAEKASSDVTNTRKKEIDGKLKVIKKDLTTLVSGDPHNATRFILEKYSRVWFYKQNYRKESTVPDGRIPAGGWDYWIGRLGFSRRAIRHIRSIGTNGTPKDVKVETANALADMEKLEPGSRRRLSKTIKDLARREIQRRFNVAIGSVAGLVVSLSLSQTLIMPSVAEGPDWQQYLIMGAQWVGWISVGAIVASVSSIARQIAPEHSRVRNQIDWPSFVSVSVVSLIMLVLTVMFQPGASLDLAAANLHVNFGYVDQISLPWTGFLVGFFYQVVSNFAELLVYISSDGVVTPIVKLFNSKNRKAE